MNNTEKRKWWQLLRAVLFTVCVSLCILLLLFSFSFFVGNVSDGAILVSVLGVLVTALIGWQIYSVVGIDHRVADAEKRIEDMLCQLQTTKAKIDKTAKSSEDYTSGVNCLSVAMIEYVQTLYNRTAPINVRAKHYCTSYMVSAQAIRHLLDSKKDDELLYPIFCLCVEGLKLSSDLLFSAKYIDDTRQEFTRENHKICNGHYKYIMNRRKSLGIDNFDLITEIHNQRVELLKQ